jgi:hypothetical protein
VDFQIALLVLGVIARRPNKKDYLPAKRVRALWALVADAIGVVRAFDCQRWSAMWQTLSDVAHPRFAPDHGHRHRRPRKSKKSTGRRNVTGRGGGFITGPTPAPTTSTGYNAGTRNITSRSSCKR